MNRNSSAICGTKTITLPTPAITPSTSRSRSGPGRHHAGHQVLNPGDLRLDQADGRLRPREERLEQHQHHGGEHGEAPHAVGQHTIDALGPREARPAASTRDRLGDGRVDVRGSAPPMISWSRSRPACSGARPDAARRPRARPGGCRPGRRAPRRRARAAARWPRRAAAASEAPRASRPTACGELADVRFGLGAQRRHRARQPGLRLGARAHRCRQVVRGPFASARPPARPRRRSAAESLATDTRIPCAAGVVGHAERDDDGNAGLDHLVGEVEVPRERGCVGDHDDGVGGPSDAARGSRRRPPARRASAR